MTTKKIMLKELKEKIKEPIRDMERLARIKRDIYPKNSTCYNFMDNEMHIARRVLGIIDQVKI